ncbi:MAG: class I SAM-dependent methyltransferase [Hormoscilla sp. GUM202]|nr:class I SAM-dependent methyltransferase [Hormoscilla sp. GUM202]
MTKNIKEIIKAVKKRLKPLKSLMIKPRQQEVNPTGELLGYLESPQAMEKNLNGTLRVSGWILHKQAKITALMLAQSGFPEEQIAYGIERPDVAGVFPEIASAQTSGFERKIILDRNYTSKINIEIWAILENGDRLCCFTRVLTKDGQVQDDSPSFQRYLFFYGVARKAWVAYKQGRIPFLSRVGRQAWVVYKQGRLLWGQDVLYPDKIHPAIQELIRDRVKYPESFNSGISSWDEIYQHELKSVKGDRVEAGMRYYRNGSMIMDAVRELIMKYRGGFDRLDSFLDFACGYGRSTRFPIQEMPASHIWVSDIDATAVKFQMAQFGVNGIVSTTNPEEYNSDRRFDVIVASSFFSHIPEKTFTKWMQKLYSLVSPNGMLIFSVHDRSLFPDSLNAEIYFIPQSESQYLDRQEYGTTYVTEEFVSKVIQEVTGGEAKYQRLPKGLCKHQDIYIVNKLDV